MVSDCLGCNFPAYPFENQAETEGFGRMANRMGYQVIGLPNYVPILFFQYPSRLTYVRWSGILILRRKRTIKPPRPPCSDSRGKTQNFSIRLASNFGYGGKHLLCITTGVNCLVHKYGNGPERIYTTCHYWISTLILAEWDCRNILLT